MDILLYGLNEGTELVEKCLRSEHTIVGYSDSFSSISLWKGKPFYKNMKNYLQLNLTI